MLTIVRQSPITGTINEMVINMSPEEYDTAVKVWQSGVYIQDAFHMLSADEREFIKTGITPAEWNNLFGSEEE